MTRPKPDNIVENMLAQGDKKRLAAGRTTASRRRKVPPIELPERFSIDWPPGYEPHFTAADLERMARAKRLQERSTAAAEAKLGHAGRDMGLPGSLRNGGVGRL